MAVYKGKRHTFVRQFQHLTFVIAPKTGMLKINDGQFEEVRLSNYVKLLLVMNKFGIKVDFFRVLIEI
jgi:hypothetical protein